MTDEKIVEVEVGRLRGLGQMGSNAEASWCAAKAELLAAAPVEVAARFLRESALRSLTKYAGYEEWAVSAVIERDVFRELRRHGRWGDHPRVR